MCHGSVIEKPLKRRKSSKTPGIRAKRAKTSPKDSITDTILKQ